jgi:hypothetical protein
MMVSFATQSYNLSGSYTPWGLGTSASSYNWTTSVGNNVYTYQTEYQYTYKAQGPFWSSWTATPKPPNTSGTYAKALSTKWDKFYSGGPSSSIDKYNTSSDTWTGNVTTNYNGAFQESEAIMGQDWGYWFGYYGAYSTTGTKQFYSTDTTTYTRAMSYGHSSGHQNWGPLA